MKRTVFAWAMTISMIAAPAWAQHGHGGSKPATTPHTTQAPKPPTQHGSQAPKGTSGHATGAKSTTTHGNSANAHATKTTKTATSSPKASKTTAKSTSKTGAKTTTATTTTTLSPVQQKLQQNTRLASKLQSRLPAGTNLDAAAAGFRNLGQFVAAVNVSNNLGIPFAQLKTRMVDDHMSLGQAIQDVRPATSDTTAIVRHAETDADQLISATQTSTSTTRKTHK